MSESTLTPYTFASLLHLAKLYYVGSVIAICYEKSEHENWCDHETNLSIWNINRRDFDPSVPFQQFHVHCCLTILKFHPTNPSLLIGGGYTGIFLQNSFRCYSILVFNYDSVFRVLGELFLWSIQKEGDQLLASSTMNSHSEKVTSIHWLNNQVLSSSLDGKIMLWNIDYKQQAFEQTKVIMYIMHIKRKVMK